MDSEARWLDEVAAADPPVRIIAREFASAAARVAEAWDELTTLKDTDAALERLVEIRILVNTTVRIEREDLQEYLDRLFQQYPDDSEGTD